MSSLQVCSLRVPPRAWRSCALRALVCALRALRCRLAPILVFIAFLWRVQVKSCSLFLCSCINCVRCALLRALGVLARSARSHARSARSGVGWRRFSPSFCFFGELFLTPVFLYPMLSLRVASRAWRSCALRSLRCRRAPILGFLVFLWRVQVKSCSLLLYSCINCVRCALPRALGVLARSARSGVGWRRFSPSLCFFGELFLTPVFLYPLLSLRVASRAWRSCALRALACALRALRCRRAPILGFLVFLWRVEVKSCSLLLYSCINCVRCALFRALGVLARSARSHALRALRCRRALLVFLWRVQFKSCFLLLYSCISYAFVARCFARLVLARSARSGLGWRRFSVSLCQFGAWKA